MKKTLAVALAALALACAKPQPSAQYEQARSLWSQVLAERGPEAYADPRALEVVATLGQVDRSSSDSQYALELKAEIEKGRKQALAAEAENARMLEKAEIDAHPPVVEIAAAAAAPAAEQPAPAPAASAAAQPDAGSNEPELEMDAAEFKSRFSRCFELKSPSLVGGAAGGEIWGLKDLKVCRELHPQFATKGVLLFEGKVRALQPLEDLKPQRYRVVNGQLVPAEEAERLEKEAAAKAAKAAPPPEAPPAEEAQYAP